jgi:trehalose 6-phosphate synthase
MIVNRIDVSSFEQVAARSRSNRIVSQTIAGLGSRKLIIGVDRLDYSKGYSGTSLRLVGAI